MEYSETDAQNRRDVREVQNMLLFLSRCDPSVLRVNPTGIYGEESAASVASFQRSRGLPVTGEVDEDTYDLITQEYEKHNHATNTSRAIYPFERMLEGNCVREGDAFDLVMILQILLDAISTADDGITGGGITGVFDDATRRNVEQFQRTHGLEETGIVDRITWDRLADTYNATRFDQ